MSDLLNQASLVYIPSGYKEDTAYSVIPTDGSGDLTFSRASDGTRVNSQGYVERVPWNLLEQSNAFSTSPWSKSAGTTLTSGQTDANGGTTAFRVQMSSANNYLASGIYTVVSGSIYTYTIYIKSNTGSNQSFRIVDGVIGVAGGVLNGTATTSWQRVELQITPNSTSGAFQLDNNGGAYSNDLLICFSQANLGSTAKPYFPTTDRLNVPRLDYSNGCPSLLLEPQRTNLALYSEQFDNAAWLKEDISVTSNATTSPDGTQNADKVIANTNNTDHTIYQSTTASANEYFTVYAKAGEYNYVFLGANNSVATDGVFFNLSNGTISQNTSSLTATITDAGNGWYRCGVYSSSWPYVYRIICLSENGTSFGFVGDNSKGIYLYGAQVEAGSYPTSYIPTTSASVTRVADAAYKTGISSLIGQTEGAIFWDMEYFDPDRYLSIADTTGSSNNYLLLWHTSNIPRIALRGSGTNAVVNTISSYPSTPNTRYKYAVSWTSGGDFYVYRNGVQIFSTTIGTLTLSAPFDAIKFADRDDSPTFDGKINQTLSFTSALTNAELAALTTL